MKLQVLNHEEFKNDFKDIPWDNILSLSPQVWLLISFFFCNSKYTVR